MPGLCMPKQPIFLPAGARQGPRHQSSKRILPNTPARSEASPECRLIGVLSWHAQRPNLLGWTLDLPQSKRTEVLCQTCIRWPVRLGWTRLSCCAGGLTGGFSGGEQGLRQFVETGDIKLTPEKQSQFSPLLVAGFVASIVTVVAILLNQGETAAEAQAGLKLLLSMICHLLAYCRGAPGREGGAVSRWWGLGSRVHRVPLRLIFAWPTVEGKSTRTLLSSSERRTTRTASSLSSLHCTAFSSTALP